MPDEQEREETQDSPVTGGTRSGAGKPDAVNPEREKWGAAEDDDAHQALGDDFDLSPDEAAEVLFGDEADEVRAFKHDEEEPEGA